MKPEKTVREPLYDYRDVINYIEKKYQINTSDYAGRFKDKHFRKWLNLVNEEAIIHPMKNKEVYFIPKISGYVIISEEEYKRIWEDIFNQNERYEEWCIENPKPPYLNFWSWLTANDFKGVSNGGEATLNIRYWLEKFDDLEDWRREILQLIYNEFQSDIDDKSWNGTIRFWVVW